MAALIGIVFGMGTSSSRLFTKYSPSFNLFEFSTCWMPASAKRSASIFRSTRSTCSSLGPCQACRCSRYSIRSCRARKDISARCMNSWLGELTSFGAWEDLDDVNLLPLSDLFERSVDLMYCVIPRHFEERLGTRRRVRVDYWA